MSHETETRDPSDVGPGFMDAVGVTVREGIARYVIGFVLASLLTAASFYVLDTSLIWGPGIPVALIVLAIAGLSGRTGGSRYGRLPWRPRPTTPTTCWRSPSAC